MAQPMLLPLLMTTLVYQVVYTHFQQVRIQLLCITQTMLKLLELHISLQLGAQSHQATTTMTEQMRIAQLKLSVTMHLKITQA